jgi:hypothetical protein
MSFYSAQSLRSSAVIAPKTAEAQRNAEITQRE